MVFIGSQKRTATFSLILFFFQSFFLKKSSEGKSKRRPSSSTGLQSSCSHLLWSKVWKLNEKCIWINFFRTSKSPIWKWCHIPSILKVRTMICSLFWLWLFRWIETIEIIISHTLRPYVQFLHYLYQNEENLMLQVNISMWMGYYMATLSTAAGSILFRSNDPLSTLYWFVFCNHEIKAAVRRLPDGRTKII